MIDARAQEMLEQVRANQARLGSCPKHDFEPVPPLRPILQRYRCKVCEGTIDSHAHYWYLVGQGQACG